MASVKGELFEFFVCKLLLNCGFKPVVKDNLLVFDGRPGTMIQGLGQAHNADVLLDPPFQTPFYFPTRLLVECKCYSDTIGLSVVRNALGLREDINRCDIVTEEILQNRRLSHTKKTTCHPVKRYTYQVAVASMSGFKATVIPFAQTHRIPLISFSDSMLFTNIRACIESVESMALVDRAVEVMVREYINDNQYKIYIDNTELFRDTVLYEFLKLIEDFQNKITVGLLEDGTLLFLIKQSNHCYSNKGYTDGCEIHWNTRQKAWNLYDGNQEYQFELPKEIYKEWIESVDGLPRAALDVKERYLSKIVLFEKNFDGINNTRTIYLSEAFIEKAKNNL